MEDEHGFTSAKISVRIVHIDHYLHPLRDYSSSLPFQAARLTHAPAHTAPKLPVIRIFGATPAGQTCCVHLHGLRPYLYLPLPQTIPPAAAFAYATRLRHALESALRTAYADEAAPATTAPPDPVRPAPSPHDAQNIAEIEPVLKKDIYGYHPSARVFLKIHAYNPRTIPRVATMVAQNSLPEDLVPRHTPVYEAHIPFHMQFLIDHALSGMAYLNLADFRFRPPLSTSTRPAARLYARRNADRLFVAGLENDQPTLFWPFHVPKRSTCQLELDSFPQHVLNACPTEDPDGEYAFVSRTLGVLWEEERLRTGDYPPRQTPPNRKVKAGSQLSDPLLRGKLAEVIAADAGSRTRVPQSQPEDVVASFRASQSANPGESPSLPVSYDDVLHALDASGSLFSEEDDPIVPDFDDDVEDDVAAREGERHGPNDGPPLPENLSPSASKQDEEIDADWAAIVACTQHVAKRDVETADEPPGRGDDEHQREEVLEDEIIASPLRDLNEGDETLSCPIISPEVQMQTDKGINQSEKELSLSPEHPEDENDAVPSDVMFPPAQRLGSSEGTEYDSIIPADDLAVYTFVRPKERPPSASSLAEKRTISDAFSIAHTTPFYGEKQDEVSRRQAFGGLIIPVRKSGADGYDPFPVSFDIGRTTVEIAPRVIRPTERPPTLSSLKSSSLKHAIAAGDSTRRAKFAIDSAGRQVRHRTQGTGRDPLTLSNDLAADFLVEAAEVGNLSSIFETSSDSESSAGPTSELQATYEDKPLNEEHSDSFVQNRPLSPKYDEGYQHYVLPSRPGSRRESSFARSRFTRNSTVSLSESRHRYQNLTVMSIELLAESYGDRLSDPVQNSILSVCTVLQKDYAEHDGQAMSCVVFALRTEHNPQRLAGMTLLSYESEANLLDALAAHIRQEDPDILVGFETQQSSVGYILERSIAITHSFPQVSSRWMKGSGFDGARRGGQGSNSAAAAYYHRKGADIKITGRHVLSLWRIVRKEVKLGAYSREAVASELFQTTFPKHGNRDLEDWFRSASHAPRTIMHLARMAYLNIGILNRLNILSRIGELARVFGVDFMSVFTRGSQFRVESMLGRVSRLRDYLLLSAAREEVFQQPAVEALPLVMEPQSALYVDPVIVLDFQSLYPSVIIAHNLCFSTMLGNVNRISTWSEGRRVGVVPQYSPPVSERGPAIPAESIYVSSSGEMFVDASVRPGILPQLLKEILETRVMVKKAMKGIANDEATAGMLNARQFGLKMIANVTYGYTAASFSGRMPCAGLADAIVQCGRDSLEEITRFVEEELRPETGATVVYGDTDSLFVKVPGASREEAFSIGERIVARAADIFPEPITLKLEKVYQPCILQTKKRYVGYSYESRDQAVPIFDAKGIETVRRDSCPLVQKTLEKAIRVLFETKDVSLVKRYVQRLCQKLHLDRIPFSEYIFRKEVRLGSYKEGHLPPAAIVATKAMEQDPRAVPRHGERVPFVVLYNSPGAPLKDCVVSPEDFLYAAQGGLARLNTTYYITKQILPALDRVFSLIGVRVSGWYAEVPRPVYDPIIPAQGNEKRRLRSKQSSLHMFYTSEKCTVCHGKGVERQVCEACIADPRSVQATRFLVGMRCQEQERIRAELTSQCFACVSDRASCAGDVRCTNLICSVHDKLTVVTKKLNGLRQILDDDSIWST